MASALTPLLKPRRRPVCLALLVGVVLLGLGSRAFAAWLPAFIVANAGDALWTVAAYLGLALLFPALPPIALAATSLAVSFAVEFGQLWDASWLNALRGTGPGRLLLGSGFLSIDLLRYTVGAVAAGAVDYLLTRNSRSAN